MDVAGQDQASQTATPAPDGPEAPAPMRRGLWRRLAARLLPGPLSKPGARGKSKAAAPEAATDGAPNGDDRPMPDGAPDGALDAPDAGAAVGAAPAARPGAPWWRRARSARQGTPRAARAKERAPKRDRPPPAPPIQVLIGWIGDAARKDVIAHARGLAEDQLASLENTWISMAPFRGGFFYEIHEGGAGRAYLPGLIEQLDRDPEQILWLPAGTAINRVLTVGITDNIPYAVILTETESALVRQSG